ncbi:3-coathanger stack domain-containing protein [uncultured Arcticibacterium sp.]|uniref:immunoglobulin domain-containing protein n=1 Tax=uncultured Arcticibacterium sp. TaxID=2173042 RepID=UPI0030F6751C
MKKCILPLIIIFCLVQTSVFATTRYVKPTASGAGDGSSWANASADLQAMINASASGDEVWVAAGVYKPLADGSGNTSPTDSRNKLFYMRDGVKLYGGYSGAGTTRDFSTYKTILSGDIDNDDTNTDGNFINESVSDIQGANAYHVLVFPSTGETTEVDGFIITGGKNTGNSGSTSTTTSAGGNFNSFRGAALYFTGAAPQIRNCVISGNSGYSGVLYQNNQNTSGGWTTKLENLIWVGNYANSGVLYLHRGPTEITSNVFASNSASSSVIYISSNMPNANSITYDHISLFNNTPGQYSYLFLLQGGTVQIKNSTVWKEVPANNAVIYSSAHSLTVSNSSIQGSGGSSDWNGGFGTDGGNNLDLAPQFSNAGNIAGADAKYFTSDDGLIPGSCSPLLNNAAAGLIKDIANQSRPNEGQNDIGAYEFQGVSTLPSDATGVSSSSYSITCGQSVTLSGSCGTGTLTWYNQASGGSSIGTGTGFVASPLENPTIYYAACETSATCVSLNRVAVPSISVSLPTNPTGVAASENDTCPNTEVALSASCSGGTSPEWYDGSMSVIGTGSPFQVSPTITTTYAVKCKNGSCVSDTEEITVNVLGRPTDDNASPGNICAGQSVTYTANCAVGTVEWYDSYTGGNLIATGNSHTFTPSHGSSNYYRIFPACTNGTCTSNREYADSYFYFAPPSVTVSETALCASNNTELTLTANCTSYAGGTVTNWYDAASGGNLLGTGNTFNHTPSSTITYYAECVSNNYSCSTPRTATDEVVVGQPVSTPSSVSVNDTEVCVNSDITLSASCSSGTAVWYSSPSGGSSIGNGGSLVYNVTATNTFYVACEDGGCISNRVATAEVTVLPSSSGIPMNQTLNSNITGTDTKQAIEYINASNKIINPANVVYESGKAINLAPGFEVENGSVFLGKADLEACP